MSKKKGYPGSYPIAARQGMTFKRQFTWTLNEVPVNLTGGTARMQVRRDASSPTIVLNASAYITLGGVRGTVDLNIPASILSAVEAGKYAYDLEVEISAEVTTLLEGSFTVAAEVTR